MINSLAGHWLPQYGKYCEPQSIPGGGLPPHGALYKHRYPVCHNHRSGPTTHVCTIRMIQLNSSFLAWRWYSFPWRNINQLMFLWRLSFFISVILHVWWVLFWKNWGNCTTVCDTCYLKWLLIRIWMILMYHNKNVTSPIRHNKHEHHTDISTQHSWVIICTAQIRPRRNIGMLAEYVRNTVPRDISVAFCQPTAPQIIGKK